MLFKTNYFEGITIKLHPKYYIIQKDTVFINYIKKDTVFINYIKKAIKDKCSSV